MNPTDTIRIVWNQLDKTAWDNALSRVPYYAYQQSWAYGQTAEIFGAHIARAGLYVNERLVGVVQFQHKTWMKCLQVAIAMRGPAWVERVDEAVQARLYRDIKKTAPFKWPHICMLMPEAEQDSALQQAKARHIMTSYHTVMLDLTQEESQLRATLDGKWRNRLKVAEKSALHVEPVGLKPLQYQWLLEKEIEQSARIGYAALSPALVPIFQEQAGKKSLHIIKAIAGKEVVAGMLCLLHGNSATYHIGWSNDMGKQMGAHNLLMWQMICQLKAKGIMQCDLGGVNTEEEGAGIARFKIGTGGRVVSLCGTWLL